MLLSRVFTRSALRDFQQTPSRLCNAIHTVPTSSARPFGAVLSVRGYATDVVEDANADTTVVIKKRTRSPRTKDIASPSTDSASKGRGRPKGAVSAPKKVETEEEKIKQKIALHKRHALLDRPQGLPTTAWRVYISQSKRAVRDMHATSEAFKDLSFSDKEVTDIKFPSTDKRKRLIPFTASDERRSGQCCCE